MVKKNGPSFMKKSFTKRYETPSTHYLRCVPILLFRSSFVVGLQIVCSPLYILFETEYNQIEPCCWRRGVMKPPFSAAVNFQKIPRSRKI